MESRQLQQDLDVISHYIKNNFSGGSTFFVTGGTGLIGSLIIKAILQYNRTAENKMKVITTVRSREKFNEVFCEYVGDLYLKAIYKDVIDGQFDVTDQIDYIVHTACPTNSKYFISNPVEVLDTIYIGTRNVLEIAKKHNVVGMVYLSSMEVFGQTFKEQRLTENDLGYIDIGSLRSCYPEGKRAAECLCNAFAEEYGVPVCIARLAQTFGAGVSKHENRVFAQFAKSAIRGEDIVLHTTGQSVGNYCYTVDAVKAILLLLQQGLKGEVYTVVNEKATMTIADMAKLVALNFSNGKSKIVFDIPDGNRYGYAEETKMKLSSEKLRTLGWGSSVDLIEAYRRLIDDIMDE